MTQKQMYIYKVSQDENNDYDTYDSFVVVAFNEDQARKTSPNDNDDFSYYDFNVDYGRDCYWASSESNVKVELIGVADEKYTEPTIICSSFNAA